MTKDSEHEFKKKAFGNIKYFQPTKELLSKPLKCGAFKVFCTNCGSYREFSHETVEQLEELTNKSYDPEKYFLEVTSCINVNG